MKNLLAGAALLLLVSGCSSPQVPAPLELTDFIEMLKEQGVDGKLAVREPINSDMEYVAEYAVAKYTSTRIISLFKLRDSDAAERNLQQALQNEKLSGQARNGSFVMAATFFPPDDEAAEQIKTLFLEHRFE
ncbi:MAG: hypothetical protein RQ736_00650 [Thiogranum sp.]|nr:hypothetical protein [Thiogranum sp.]